MPEPIDESHDDFSHVLVGGYPGEVIVRIEATRISVSEFSLVWEGPHTSVVHPILVAKLNWKKLPLDQIISALQKLIQKTSETRKAKYQTCELCHESNPPEWMMGGHVCHSCAEKHYGVVF